LFGGINKIFATATVEGALAMAGNSIDLEAMQDAAVSSIADVLLTGEMCGGLRVQW
jgi:hypothetical protein